MRRTPARRGCAVTDGPARALAALRRAWTAEDGRDTGRWGYIGNAFVLAAYRSQGTGSRLLAAVLAYADSCGFARVVLHPNDRVIPFYQRAGFTFENDLLVRPGARRSRLSPGSGSGGRPTPSPAA